MRASGHTNGPRPLHSILEKRRMRSRPRFKRSSMGRRAARASSLILQAVRKASIAGLALVHQPEVLFRQVLINRPTATVAVSIARTLIVYVAF